MDHITQKLYSDYLIKYSKLKISGFPSSCENCTQEEGNNSLCGDNLKLKISSNMLEGYFCINDLFYEGTGCALFLASTNLMIEIISNSKYYDTYFYINYNLIRQAINKNLPELENNCIFKPFEGIRNFPSREKCVLLPWETADRLIQKERKLCGC